MGLSLAVSPAAYLVASAGAEAGAATAEVVVDRQEQDVEIQFAAVPHPRKRGTA